MSSPTEAIAAAPAAHRRSGPLEAGELALLVGDDGRGGLRRHLVRLDGDTTKVAGLGVVNLANLEGLSPGAGYKIGREILHVYRPNAYDLLVTVRRKAQIVTPKDAAAIISMAGIGPGSRVVEAGIGSGALTIALAHAVGPTGKVFNHEIREDFQRHALQNLEMAGLRDRVEAHLGDVTQGIPHEDVDAVVMDMPTPWLVVPHARRALVPGGTFVSYTPIVQQMQRTVEALRDNGFWDIQMREVIVRDWAVIDSEARGGKGEGGARPQFDMLGHTAFLASGRSPGHDDTT